MIHIFIGTKAQYIKTAPLIRLMDRRGVAYRLVDSGQHAALSVGLRHQLEVRAPDIVLGNRAGSDVESIPEALAWTMLLATHLTSRRRLQQEVFGGEGGVCVVHGDTPSTLLSALMARRAGLRVAHLEAGLRSHHWFHPFPEELIRIAVMRISHLLFAMSETAEANLRRMDLPGEIVRAPSNTIHEALVHNLDDPPEPGSGPVIVTMHRVENLSRPQRVDDLVDTAADIAAHHPVRFVQHGPTRRVLARRGAHRRLERAGVELVGLLPHAEFVEELCAAPFVITDGGSIQEECAALGVPTLLWRGHTERDDGLGRNVVLADYERERITAFLRDPQRFRHPPLPDPEAASEAILDRLLVELERTGLAGGGPAPRRAAAGT